MKISSKVPEENIPVFGKDRCYICDRVIKDDHDYLLHFKWNGGKEYVFVSCGRRKCIYISNELHDLWLKVTDLEKDILILQADSSRI